MKKLTVLSLVMVSSIGLSGCGALIAGAAITAATSGHEDRQTYHRLSCSQLRAKYAKNIKRAHAATKIVDPGETATELNAQAAFTVLRRKGCRRS
ncbi:hypothetical protein N9M66_02995 [Litoreibacter sp.]|nr:hypothetical protein [Litoreibacter sp.]